MKTLDIHIDQKQQALNFFKNQDIEYKINPTLHGSLIVEFEFINEITDIELKMIYNVLR